MLSHISHIKSGGHPVLDTGQSLFFDFFDCMITCYDSTNTHRDQVFIIDPDHQLWGAPPEQNTPNNHHVCLNPGSGYHFYSSPGSSPGVRGIHRAAGAIYP